jgi:glycosyltransferase involved in cell wall biosynthesis
MVLSAREATDATKGRRRIVFITAPTLGFATFDRNIRVALERSDAADTIHVTLQAPFYQQMFAKAFRQEPQVLSSAFRRRLAWLCHAPAISRLVREVNADVFHITPPFLGPLAVAVARATGRPFGVGLDVTIPLSVQQPWTPVDRWLEAIDRRTLRHAALAAPFSEWAAESVRGYGVKNFVVTPPAKAVAAAAQRRPGRSGPTRIAYIGNDWVRKGGERLVRWHQQHLPHTELHLVGRDVPRVSGRNIFNHGAMMPARLLDTFLPSIDILCLPTAADMSPQTLVEAAAAAVPAVTSRMAGLPELVLHERTGLLCGVSDDYAWIEALDRLSRDGALVNSYGEAARSFALTHFEQGVVFARLLDRLLAVAGG